MLYMGCLIIVRVYNVRKIVWDFLIEDEKCFSSLDLFSVSTEILHSSDRRRQNISFCDLSCKCGQHHAVSIKMAENCVNLHKRPFHTTSASPTDWSNDKTFSAQNHKNPNVFAMFDPKKGVGAAFFDLFLTTPPKHAPPSALTTPCPRKDGSLVLAGGRLRGF